MHGTNMKNAYISWTMKLQYTSLNNYSIVYLCRHSC